MAISQEIVPEQWAEICKIKESIKRPCMLPRITQITSHRKPKLKYTHTYININKFFDNFIYAF